MEIIVGSKVHIAMKDHSSFDGTVLSVDDKAIQLQIIEVGKLRTFTTTCPIWLADIAYCVPQKEWKKQCAEAVQADKDADDDGEKPGRWE